MGIEKTLIDEAGASNREKPTRKRRHDPVYGNEARCRKGKPKRGMGSGSTCNRKTLTLAVAAREYIWLYDHNHGIGIDEIAAREGLPRARVDFGVKRARAIDERSWNSRYLREDDSRRLRLIPLFPIGPYTPQSTCPHTRPIRPGSSFCCMVCHSSGMDAHPTLRRDPRTDPAPEPKDEPGPKPALRPEMGEMHETRKQRRKRMFAQQTTIIQSRSE